MGSFLSLYSYPKRVLGLPQFDVEREIEGGGGSGRSLGGPLSFRLFIVFVERPMFPCFAYFQREVRGQRRGQCAYECLRVPRSRDGVVHLDPVGGDPSSSDGTLDGGEDLREDNRI